jgi:hypothetical protein
MRAACYDKVSLAAGDGSAANKLKLLGRFDSIRSGWLEVPLQKHLFVDFAA